MASSIVSLRFLSLPSSNTAFPSPFHLSSSSLTPPSKLFSIPTSSKLFKATTSSPIVPKVALSLDVELDDDLSSAGDVVSEQPFSPELKLFVGNLPFNVDNAALARLFERSGNVEVAEVVYNKLSRRSRGFGFVKMSSIKEAETAANKFNGYELDGRQLKVNYGPPPRKKSFIKEPRDRVHGDGDERSKDDTNTVYVGNLSWNVDNQTLEALFWEHGNVMKAKVFYYKDSGKSRGFGFVTYSSPDEVYSAVESLDGADLHGRNIRVSVALPSQRHNFKQSSYVDFTC